MSAAHRTVPVEFTGRARELRRRLAAADALAQPMMRRALVPIQKRLQRHPVVRRDTLVDVERQWRGLPAFGQIRCTVNVGDRRAPTFDCVRLAPAQYTGLDWNGGIEAGVVAVLFCASVRGATMTLRAHTVAAVSLHCLARRFQRGPRCTDDDVIAEIGVLALKFPTLADSGEFEVAVETGCWIGHVIETADRQVVVSARTFLDADGDFRAATSGLTELLVQVWCKSDVQARPER